MPMHTPDTLSALTLNTASRKAQAVLDDSADITTVVLATVDGFAVVSAMRGSADASRIAALASSIASIGSVATQEAGLGRCTSLTLNTEGGVAVVRHLAVDGVELVLIMVADGSGLLAHVMYQANQLAQALVSS